MKIKPTPLAILSQALRTIWFFFPGLLFIILGFFTFYALPQGQDLVLQSRISDSFLKLLFILIGLAFWAFTTWYTARILAYNEDFLFKNAPWAVTWVPRLLGFGVFSTFGVAISSIAESTTTNWSLVIYFAFNILIFNYLCLLRVSKKKHEILYSTLFIWISIGLIHLGFILLYVFWSNLTLALGALSIIQLSALYWVSFRNPTGLIDHARSIFDDYEVRGIVNHAIKLIFNWDVKKFSREVNESFFQTEGTLFRIYNLVALLAVIGYFLVVSQVNIGRQIGSFAFVLLAFGILLGVGNALSLLSYRTNPKINLHFILIVIVLTFGNWTEPHPVQLINRADNSQRYQQRDSLVQHLRMWISDTSRAQIIRDNNAQSFPLLFAIADGGASRSGFWTSIVLSQLHDRTKIKNANTSYFNRHLFCLAGASGGSVGNGTFLSALIAQQEGSTNPTYGYCQEFLNNDFLTYPLARLLGPELLKPVFNFKWWGDRAQALEYSLETANYRATPIEVSMAKLMHRDFDCYIRTKAYCPPIFCINVTRMQDSRPAIISNIQVEQTVFGDRLDVFSCLPPKQGLKVSTALVLGARFPYFSPAGKIGDSYFVDGGYFDNSGAGPVHEIILALERLKNKYKSPQFKPQAADSLLIPFLKKMHYYVVHTQNTPLVNKPFKKVHPAINDLAAPVITLAGSYGAQTNVNNSRLENYLRELQPGENTYLSINLYHFENDKFPMSWVISDPKIDLMIKRSKNNPLIDSLVYRLNHNQLDKLFTSLKKK